MRLNKKNRAGFVGPASCVAALGLVALGLACPGMDGAHALDPTTKTGTSSCGFDVTKQAAPTDTTQSGTTNFNFNVYKDPEAVTDSATTDFSFEVQEFIQITTDSTSGTIDVDMNVDNPTGGVFTSNSADFTVAANNANGFGVYVYAPDDAKRNLSSQDVNNTAKITPVSGSDVASSAFGDNTWGYNVTAGAAATTFKPITTVASSSAVYTQQTPSAGTDLKLTCGTKVNASIPADTYSTDVVVSAVAPFTARP